MNVVTLNLSLKEVCVSLKCGHSTVYQRRKKILLVAEEVAQPKNRQCLKKITNYFPSLKVCDVKTAQISEVYF